MSSASSRYFPNPFASSLSPNPDPPPDFHAELLASLSRINSYNPPVQTCSTGWTFNGFYAGPTSIAYLFYRLSQVYPSLSFKGQSLLDWATAYLELGSTRLSRHLDDVDPSRCGIANETLCQIAMRSVMERDQSLAQRLCAFSSVINGEHEDVASSNEWLYGRAGYLYLLRLVSTAFSTANNASIKTLLAQTITKTISHILNTPQPWSWYGEDYLGAAHGVIGIITQIALSSPSHSAQLEPVLSQVLDTQLDSGNFPTTLPPSHPHPRDDDDDDTLVQFCHGSPGLILSLLSLRPHFSHNPELSSRIDGAVARAQADVWIRGLLTKPPSLCHGIAGNALAFLSSSSSSAGKEKGLRFLSFMTSAALEADEHREWNWMAAAGRGGDFAGLYTGEAGRAWAWAVADSMMNEEGGDKGVVRGCIGYNDL